jgi:hypothetical protein
MFSGGSTTVFEIESFEPGRVAALAGILEQLVTFDPDRALASRFGFMLLFEKAGIALPQNDLRSRRFLAELRGLFPGFCYFIHADPPFYHLRNISMALAADQAEPDAFLTTHHQCFLDASKIALNLGDLQSKILEDAFIVNLLHRHMDNKIRLRALKTLRPMLLAALDDQDSKLSAKAFREAALLTDRNFDEFSSARAFVLEMEQILDSYL